MHILCVAHRAQATSLKKHLLELKIERITQTGIDQMPSPPPSPTAESTVLDIATAQVSRVWRVKHATDLGFSSARSCKSDRPRRARSNQRLFAARVDPLSHLMCLGRARAHSRLQTDVGRQ